MIEERIITVEFEGEGKSLYKTNLTSKKIKVLKEAFENLYDNDIFNNCFEEFLDLFNTEKSYINPIKGIEEY